MRPSATGALASAAMLAVFATTGCSGRPASAEPPQYEPARLVDIALAPETEILRTIVPPGTTLSALLSRHRVLATDVVNLVDSVAAHFDLRRLRAGQPYRLARSLDGRIREFEYELDGDRRLVARRLSDAVPAVFETEIAIIPKTFVTAIVEGNISRETPSLVAALQAEGEQIELSLALADIFSGEIDFNSDLHPDDSFRLVVERAIRDDGTDAGYGPIRAAELVNGGRRLRAIRFSVAGERPAYYDEQGRSLKRFLLKSPLRFDPRITSGFSRARRHPILNYTRAHNGVDYAAPTGAPVVAVASGVVTSAGWRGGGGRTVKLRHAGGYESEYLHLSAIAPGIRSGVRVGQGELIGRVGATGLATGPHLHYGLKRNGAYVNPVREHLNMPPGEPVPAEALVVFAVERDRLFDRLESRAVRADN